MNCSEEIHGLHPVDEDLVLNLVVEKSQKKSWDQLDLNLSSTDCLAATLLPGHHCELETIKSALLAYYDILSTGCKPNISL